MNEIEAVEYFESLIKRFEDKPDETYWGKAHNATSRDAISTALTALREQAEISKGCVWCKEDYKVLHDGKHYRFCYSYCGKKFEGNK